MSLSACTASTVASSARGRERPPLLRALGPKDPPEAVEVAELRFERRRIYKHDSWAATALYCGPGGRRIICKFNRQEAILGLPMNWLGRRLARRESRFLALMADHPLVPD